MSILEKLPVTNHSPIMSISESGRLRFRLIEGLQEQIAASKAMVSGEPYRRYRDRMITNPETGEKELKSMPVRLRPWYWKDQTGKHYVGLRYANNWLELKPGKTAVEVGDAENIPTVLEKLLEAVNAGELDGVLAKAAENRKAQFTSRKKGKPAIVKN